MRTTQGVPRNRVQPGGGRHASSRRTGEQAVRPASVRQASVTSATLTPAERGRLHAIRPSSPAPARPRATQPRGAEPPALRRTTGIVITAAGAILFLAVHATVAFVATQRAGLVLLATGLLWLWIPVPDKRNRLQRRFNQLMSFLEWDPAPAQSAKCSLQDLLEPRSHSGPDGTR